MNCNLKELFSCMKLLVDVISSEQTHVKILAYLKLLKMVHVSVLEFDASKYVKKFRNTKLIFLLDSLRIQRNQNW